MRRPEPPAPTKVPSTREAMRKLLVALRRYQNVQNVSDEYMAGMLGIPRTTWTAVKNDNYRPSLEFVQKVWMVPGFRELAHAILEPERAPVTA